MRLNIAYSSDDNYARHVGVSMLSLFENNKEFNEIYVYVIDNGIKKNNKDKLNHITNQYGRKIIYIPFSKLTTGLKTDNNFSLSAFGRLFLSRISEVEKIIYLDADSVVHNSLRDLWEYDMKDYSIAGVQDTVDSYYKTSIGLSKSYRYINSGFLLINLTKWRRENIEKKFLNFISSYGGSVPHHDQGTINAVCQEDILILHPKYNVQSPMFTFTVDQIKNLYGKRYYSNYEIKEALTTPHFIHFTNGFLNRPWNINSTHPFKNIYLKYLEKSPWCGKLETNNLNRNTRIMMKFYENTPFFIFALIYSLNSIRKEIKLKLKSKRKSI